MMLEPSIDELLEKIDSKYMLVSLSAKRARKLQLVENDEQGGDWEARKYVSRALREISSDQLTYLPGSNEERQGK